MFGRYDQRGPPNHEEVNYEEENRIISLTTKFRQEIPIETPTWNQHGNWVHLDPPQVNNIPYEELSLFPIQRAYDPLGLFPRRAVLGINGQGIHFLCPDSERILRSVEMRHLSKYSWDETFVTLEIRIDESLLRFGFKTLQAEEVFDAISWHLDNEYHSEENQIQEEPQETFESDDEVISDYEEDTEMDLGTDEEGNFVIYNNPTYAEDEFSDEEDYQDGYSQGDVEEDGFSVQDVNMYDNSIYHEETSDYDTETEEVQEWEVESEDDDTFEEPITTPFEEEKEVIFTDYHEDIKNEIMQTRVIYDDYGDDHDHEELLVFGGSETNGADPKDTVSIDQLEKDSILEEVLPQDQRPDGLIDHVRTHSTAVTYDTSKVAEPERKIVILTNDLVTTPPKDTSDIRDVLSIFPFNLRDRIGAQSHAEYIDVHNSPPVRNLLRSHIQPLNLNNLINIWDTSRLRSEIFQKNLSNVVCIHLLVSINSFNLWKERQRVALLWYNPF